MDTTAALMLLGRIECLSTLMHGNEVNALRSVILLQLHLPTTLTWLHWVKWISSFVLRHSDGEQDDDINTHITKGTDHHEIQ